MAERGDCLSQRQVGIVTLYIYIYKEQLFTALRQTVKFQACRIHTQTRTHTEPSEKKKLNTRDRKKEQLNEKKIYYGRLSE